MQREDLRKALSFFPSNPVRRTRRDAAAQVALVVAWWLDEEETFGAIQRGDLRTVETLERYVREHAEEALSTTRRGGLDIIMPLLGSYHLDAAFTRIEQGMQGQHYLTQNREALVREHETLRARIREIEAILA
jgi:hypothetical protein